MKITDFNLTRAIYNASPKNKGGTFQAPLGVIRNFGFSPDTITDAQQDQIFNMYAQSAFDDIDAFNPDRPLPRLLYADLNNTLQETLRDAIILQINQLLKNGLAETTETSTASTGSFTSNVTPNTKIISPDQLSQDVEDELDKIRYKEWKVVKNEDGTYTIYLDEQDLIIPKTKNGIALSAITLKGLDAADLTILGEKYVIQLIDNTIARSRAFRGTWNAADTTEVGNIDTIFASTGLALTDGTTTLITANTVKGDTILVTVTSDVNFAPEEVIFDGVNWVPITDNNVERQDITRIDGELNKQIFKTSTGTSSVTSMDASDEDNQAPSVKVMKDADQVIDQKAETNKQNIGTNSSQIATERTRNNTQQTQIDDNTAGRIAWEDERSDYVRTGDIAGAIKIDLGRLPITDNAGVLEIDTSGITLSGVLNGVVATIKLVPKTTSSRTDSIFIRDSYGDASNLPNTILGQTDPTVKILDNLTTITGLNTTNRNIIVSQYDALLFEQLPANVAGQDNTARQLAQDASNAAQAANNNANSRVKKQLIENTDFNNFAELQALINDDDFVAITFADGVKISGTINDAGSPLIIAGNWVENTVFKIGKFTIDNTFKKSGGTIIGDGENITQIFKGDTPPPGNITIEEFYLSLIGFNLYIEGQNLILTMQMNKTSLPNDIYYMSYFTKFSTQPFNIYWNDSNKKQIIVENLSDDKQTFIDISIVKLYK